MSQKGRYKNEAVKSPKSSSGTDDKKWSAQFAGFINYTPDDSTAAGFSAWADETAFGDTLGYHVDLGRKLSISRDAKTGAYQATCMERAVDSVNAGLVCSARGRTPEVAMWRLLYLISHVFPEDWSKLGGTVDDRW